VFGKGCKKCSENECTEADDGYVIIGTMTLKCSSLYGEECSECNTTDCTKCKSGKEFLNCMSCESVFGEGCDKCDNEMECKECKDGFFKKYGVCVKNDDEASCSIAYGSGCKSCDANECKTVDQGYFIGGKRSVTCDAIPNKYSEIRSKISTCSPSTRGLEVRGTEEECKEDEVQMKIEIDGESPVEFCVECSVIMPNCSRCSKTNEGEIVCNACAAGYVLHGGVCESCEDKFDNKCSSCSVVKCTKRDCESGVDVSGTCQECGTLYSQCSVCSSESCSVCANGYIAKEGKCVSCQSEYGAGCSSCSAEKQCTDCQAEGCANCKDNEQIVIDNGKVSCSTCSKKYGDNCVNCSSTECTVCKSGMALNDKSECTKCSELFSNCGECDSDKCVKCSTEGWIHTDNGCYKPDEPEPSSSAVKPASSSHHSSHPISPSSSAKKGGLGTGAIVGIVLGSIAALGIIIVIVYFAVTCSRKHKKSDPGFYDDNDDFGSMSAL